MTAALFTDHKLIAGKTESGNLYAQFWGPSKVAGIVSDGCWAWMNSVDVGSFAFGVSHDCPDDLIPEVLEAWAAFRAGDLPEPTHTVEWRFSRPIFHPVQEPQG